LRDVAANLHPFLTDSVEYEPEAVKKHVKDSEVAARMTELREVLSAAEPFDVATTERVLRDLAKQRGVGAATYIHPLRLALTGRGVSPPIFDVAVALGKERSLQRLDRFIEKLPDLL
jgi:glutamyl/glutaminyl-tRNA synthetase